MKHHIYILCLLLMLGSACTKDILDKKPDKAQVVPSTLEDLQALLDNDAKMNYTYWSTAEIGAADFYLRDADFLAVKSNAQRNSYNWQKDIWEGESGTVDWNYSYENVFYANIALEGLEKLSAKQHDPAYQQARGMALFHRSGAFFVLAQLFAKPYQEATAANEMGIPLRLTSDLNVPSVRANLQQAYRQITADLEEALDCLPLQQSSKYRPSKAAACALLARVYLSMGQYGKALHFADSCIKLHPDLLDYNQLNAGATYPIAKLNKEVIMHLQMGRYTIWEKARGRVDSLLYRSYESNDLRRTVFFIKNSDGSAAFKGMYTGSFSLFTGLATDEQYLIRAECYARKGMTDKAMDDLNTLLRTRYASGKFIDLTADSAQEALDKILVERRKELLLRGLRWTDLRRLNLDPRYAVTLHRSIEGVDYTLSPNDVRYVLPIPDYIINITGMPQNIR